ncbi:MAG TPA: bifunctional diaminohydroxyphosphoribosylaminopyrimidine deaminase/5-amino-6-(5-phosphoribosylamino)uracil reductase RibD [Gemmataceae bacterium]|nr:bifunctional diaminohydroxyphosphoribosylaminopyrimidine deaminase/5-amino-6-(5-phosphoribosylamino)uracil reductase RibD [Gemmataceae bacterium]
MADDAQMMQRALLLAERGRGYVEPNPLAGAVVVRQQTVVGEGWHQRFGEAHAEVHALARAGEAARGATLYVTLEPCCHHGKTPPCTEAIIKAGISRVVAAMEDPFPEVAGKGAERLRAAGIQVDMGIGEADARQLNAPYLKLLTAGKPYVHAKWAMTLDGKIATRTGDSKWISSEPARRLVHELRGRMDGIVVGIGTALADNPLLTARPPGPRTPCRIVLDSQGRLPPNFYLATTARQTPTLVVTADPPPLFHAEHLTSAGCQILSIPGSGGRPSVNALLSELGRRRWTNILVEGGSEVLGSFFDAGAIDEVHVFLSPRLVGGAEAKTPIAGRGVAHIADALSLSQWDVDQIDGDLLLHGWRNV